MAYDNKFKKRTIEYYYEHGNVRKTSKVFGISTNTFNEWHKEYKEHGRFLVKSKPANRTKLKEQDMLEYLDTNPDHYQEEIAKHFKVTQAAVCKALKRFKITRKKRQSDT